jgi:hypothetical protein
MPQFEPFSRNRQHYLPLPNQPGPSPQQFNQAKKASPQESKPAVKKARATTREPNGPFPHLYKKMRLVNWV